MNFDIRVTTGCSETALETIVRTSGTRPAHAAMTRLVEPWQCATAWIESAPVSSTTFFTAAGWSSTAPWSSVQVLFGTSMLARHVSIQTSKPSSTSASTIVRGVGGRQISVRTPTPWTSSTGPFVGAFFPRTCMRLHGTPSAMSSGISSSVWASAVVNRPSRRQA